MRVVNYEEIKNKVEDYYKNKVYIEQIIDDERLKKNLFSTIFPNRNKMDVTNDLHLITLYDFTIIRYESINLENNRLAKNILIIKDEKPVFSIEYINIKNYDIKYSKTQATIYEENSFYIASRIKETIIESKAGSTDNIEILDQEIGDNRKYYNKIYQFYENKDNKIVAIHVNNVIYLDGQDGFTNTTEVGKKRIGIVANKIDNALDSILGEKVKTYEISRKKQEQ